MLLHFYLNLRILVARCLIDSAICSSADKPQALQGK